MSQTVGFTLTEVEPGRAVFECEPSESQYNPIGTVHKVNFVRPVVVGSGRLRAEGRVIHAGSRLATAEARLTDAAGKLYAHAVGTCLVVSAR